MRRKLITVVSSQTYDWLKTRAEKHRRSIGLQLDLELELVIMGTLDGR